jgi:predicted transcriptional regulator
MEKRKFVGLFIPIDVLENNELSWTEKGVLAEIDALNINNKGCFAFNSHFCELFNVNNVTISRAINKLLRLNLITIENPGSRNRRMYPVSVTQKPYKKVYGNHIENDMVTLSKITGSHHIYNEINKETLSTVEKNDKERTFSEVDFTNPAIECNLQKHLISVEQK